MKYNTHELWYAALHKPHMLPKSIHNITALEGYIWWTILIYCNYEGEVFSILYCRDGRDDTVCLFQKF